MDSVEKNTFILPSSSSSSSSSSSTLESNLFHSSSASPTLSSSNSSLTLAYLGPPGSHSHAAALIFKQSYLSKFNNKKKKTTTTTTTAAAAAKDLILISSSTIQSVFECMTNLQAHYAMIPWENSVSGSVNQSLECLTRYVHEQNRKLHLVDDLSHLVNQSVLGIPMEYNNNLDDQNYDWKSTITQIFSHPEALSQVKSYLDAHFPSTVSRIPVSSTSEAAKLALESPYTSIAICSTKVH